MENTLPSKLASSLAEAFAFAIGIVVFLWFTRETISAVLLFFLAVVFALIINAPVVISLVIGLFNWLMTPITGAQLRRLMAVFRCT
jgi:hypothetical protein